MKSRKLGVVRGGGNVFRDLGHKNADAEQFKAMLAAEIIKALDRAGLDAESIPPSPLVRTKIRCELTIHPMTKRVQHYCYLDIFQCRSHWREQDVHDQQGLRSRRRWQALSQASPFLQCSFSARYAEVVA